MDGQNRTKLVDTKIVFPHGITLDLVNRLVYWADAYLDYIEVVDYEGKNRHTIIQGLLVSAACPNPAVRVRELLLGYGIAITRSSSLLMYPCLWKSQYPTEPCFCLIILGVS